MSKFIATIKIEVGIPIELDGETSLEVETVIRHQRSTHGRVPWNFDGHHPAVRNKIRSVVGKDIPDDCITISDLVPSP